MENNKFIVMVPNYWGRGDSIIEAANAARKVAGKRPAKGMPKAYVAFSYNPAETTKAYIDEMGCLCWEGKRPVEVESKGA